MMEHLDGGLQLLEFVVDFHSNSHRGQLSAIRFDSDVDSVRIALVLFEAG